MTIFGRRVNTLIAWACVLLTVALLIGGNAFLGATPAHLIPQNVRPPLPVGGFA